MGCVCARSISEARPPTTVRFAWPSLQLALLHCCCTRKAHAESEPRLSALEPAHRGSATRVLCSSSIGSSSGAVVVGPAQSPHTSFDSGCCIRCRSRSRNSGFHSSCSDGHGRTAARAAAEEVEPLSACVSPCSRARPQTSDRRCRRRFAAERLIVKCVRSLPLPPARILGHIHAESGAVAGSSSLVLTAPRALLLRNAHVLAAVTAGKARRRERGRGGQLARSGERVKEPEIIAAATATRRSSRTTSSCPFDSRPLHVTVRTPLSPSLLVVATNQSRTTHQLF